MIDDRKVQRVIITAFDQEDWPIKRASVYLTDQDPITLERAEKSLRNVFIGLVKDGYLPETPDRGVKEEPKYRYPLALDADLRLPPALEEPETPAKAPESPVERSEALSLPSHLAKFMKDESDRLRGLQDRLNTVNEQIYDQASLLNKYKEAIRLSGFEVD